MTFLIRPPHRIKKKQTKEAQGILDNLAKYLDESSEEPIEMLCGFWKDQQSAITYQELRKMVKAGLLTESVFRQWSNDYSVLVQNQMVPIWNSAISAGSLSQPIVNELEFAFETQTPGLMRWVSERGAEFVTSSTVEQRKAIASLLAKKVTDEHTVDELARLIRPCIGLTDGDSKATLRYYDNIVKTLREQHPRMKPESVREKALDAATKYAEKKHRARAFTIAQTEMAFAYNRGADEGVRQAQQNNLLGTCEKRWITSGDDQVCPTCAALDGTQIGMDDNFDFKGRLLFTGQKLVPPAHPRCGCAVQYIEVDKAADIGLLEESQGQETEETVQDVFDLEAKESELQELQEQSQALGEEMNRRMSEAIGRNDIAAIQQISMENGPELSRINNEISALQREISDYKARLGGHLTEDDFWSGLPSEYLNSWSYESDMSMKDEIKHALLDWSGEGYKEAKYSPILEKVIDMSSKKFNGGALYRGMSLPDDLVDSLQVGKEIMQDGLSSWSTSRDIAMQFAYEDKKPVLLVDVTNGERDALSIKAFSHMKYEDEVLYSGKARLQILDLRNETIEYSFQSEIRSKEVTIIEVQEIR